MGAPLGFSSGKSWSFPLIAPLEDGPYLVPVKINGKGPYLFEIDPDSPVSSVDAAIRSDLDLYTTRMPEELDERDKLVPVALAEVNKMQIGDTLTVSQLKVRVHNFGTYWSGGRRVRGVLGRDVIADSLIFAADRDRGLATLAVQGQLEPPADAIPISWRDYRFRSNSPRRRLTHAIINQTHKVIMHLDLGNRFSMLWPSKIAALKLPTVRVEARTTDELATTRIVDHGAMVAMLQVGGAEVNGIIMIPYGDKRTREVDLDGSLGQSFFRFYNVIANWHHSKMYLTPRNPDVVATAPYRLARWGNAFEGCADPACVQVEVESDQPAPPPPAPPAPPAPAPAPGDETTGEAGAAAAAPAPTPAPQPQPAPVMPATYTLTITRDQNAPPVDYEVVLEAVDANNKSLGLPRLLATLPKGKATVDVPRLDPGYGAAAKLVVVDVSPFPRECEQGRCVWALQQM